MCIKAQDKNQPLPRVQIVQPMPTLVSSWNALLPHVIVSCFSQAGIGDSSQQVILADKDGPFKELIEEPDELREAKPNVVPENVSAELFSTVDDHVIGTASAASDFEILSQIWGDNDDNDDAVVIEDKPTTRTSFQQGNEKFSANSAKCFSVYEQVWFRNAKSSSPDGETIRHRKKSNSQQKLQIK